MEYLMKIEAIIFDIGGVIWHHSGIPLSQKWAGRCGLNAEAFDQIVYASEWGEAAMVGTVTNKELWANIGAKLGLSEPERNELEDDDWVGRWDTDLLDYVQTLKPSYRLGIISDAFTGARERVKPWIQESLFDVIVFSAEEGVRKPDLRIYQRALERLGVAANTAVFIDDRLKNVIAAQQLGMYAIHYQSYSQMFGALQHLLNMDKGKHP